MGASAPSQVGGRTGTSVVWPTVGGRGATSTRHRPRELARGYAGEDENHYHFIKGAPGTTGAPGVGSQHPRLQQGASLAVLVGFNAEDPPPPACPNSTRSPAFSSGVPPLGHTREVFNFADLGLQQHDAFHGATSVGFKQHLRSFRMQFYPISESIWGRGVSG